MIVIVNGEKIRVGFKGGKISSLLQSLMLAREEVLVKVGGKLVPDDAEIGAKEKVEVIKVVFGG